MTQRILDNCALLDQRVRRDERGSLVAVEGSSDVPFEIRRVYYIYGTAPGTERGFHGHKRLQQWAACLSGSCTITVDDGRERRDVRLESPEKGLHIGPMTWREMRDFSPDCVLLVLASEHYDEADYIFDYAEFKSMTSGGVKR